MLKPSQVLVTVIGKVPKRDRATAPTHRSSTKVVYCWWFLKAPFENWFKTCNCSNFRRGIKLGSQSGRPWLLELVSTLRFKLRFKCCSFGQRRSELKHPKTLRSHKQFWQDLLWKRELCHKLLWYPWAPKCNWVSRLSSMSRFKRLRQPNTNLKSSKPLCRWC